jgi:hypothetical protein
MRKKRYNHKTEEKVSILRSHLVVSNLCDEQQLLQ